MKAAATGVIRAKHGRKGERQVGDHARRRCRVSAARDRRRRVSSLDARGIFGRWIEFAVGV